MKVAIVSNFPVYSGTGKVPYRLWQTFRRQGKVEADYFLTHRMNQNDHNMPEYLVEGVRVLQPFDYLASPVLSRLMLYFIDPYLLPKGYDLYHFGNHMIARFAMIRRPSVVTVHDVLQFKYPEILGHKVTSRIYNYFMEKSIGFLPRADHLICVSGWSKNELLKIFKNIDARKVSVVYNGLDHSVFYPRNKKDARQRLGWDPNKKYILHLGSEIARKQVTLLIKAFKKIKQFHPDAVLIRHGQKTDASQSLIRELGLENEIIYYGYTLEEDLPFFYSGADLLVQPSSEEGFCLPVIEAMACGLPVVATRLASLPEVCGGAEAGVIEILDEAGIADVVSQALRLTEDDRESVVKKGLHNSLRFGWEKTAESVLEVYRKVIQNRKL